MSSGIEQFMEDHDLLVLLEECRWDELTQRVRNSPDRTRRVIDSRLGWSLLHLLCNHGSTPVELLDLVASLYPKAITQPDRRYGDTPLHAQCRNSQTNGEKVQVLLKHCPDNDKSVLIRNQFGGTPLHSAANHNAVLSVLQALVAVNPRILRVTTHEGIHAVTALWHSYIQTIPGTMFVARLLSGEEDVGDERHFERFWSKVEFLATKYFQQKQPSPTGNDDYSGYVLHGLIQCSVPLNFYKVALKRRPDCAMVADANGNLPLHLLMENRPYRLKEKEAIQATLAAAPPAASHVNQMGQVPLELAICNRIPWDNGPDAILKAATTVVNHRDAETRLYPFQLAACSGGNVAIETTFHLLSAMPDLIAR